MWPFTGGDISGHHKTTQLVSAGKWPQDTTVKLWLGDSGRTFQRDLAHHGDWCHAGASEKLLGWKQDWRKRCALENSRPGKGSTFYHSFTILSFTILFYLFLFMLSCIIFLAFSIEIELLKPHWKSCKAHFSDKFYIQVFASSLVGSIRPSFTFLGNSIFPRFRELEKDVWWWAFTPRL